MLSAEFAAITGENSKINFAVEAMKDNKALWLSAKNAQGDSIGCRAIQPLMQNSAELKRIFLDKNMLGVGSALLTFLEISAKQMLYPKLKVQT